MDFPLQDASGSKGAIDNTHLDDSNLKLNDIIIENKLKSYNIAHSSLKLQPI